MPSTEQGASSGARTEKASRLRRLYAETMGRPQFGIAVGGLGRWLRGHLPECGLFALGALLRLSMVWSYDPRFGFDAPHHLDYVQWLAQGRGLPPLDALIEAYHPPLFYAIAAWVAGGGMDRTALAWLPVLFGIARLAVIWCGLEWYLPRQRRARLAALALAVVMPASVHVDGMVYPEPLNGLLAAAAMLLIPRAFQAAPGRSKWLLTTAIGVVLGLEMLTKVSGLTLVVAVAALVVCERLWPRPGVRGLALAEALPWSAALLACIGIAGWFYLRNYFSVGKVFIGSFDLSHQPLVAGFAGMPYWQRRPPGFLLGWSFDIYAWPYWPSSLQTAPRFFPAALASSFVDYWNYSFSGLRPDLPTSLRANLRPLTEPILAYSRLSVVGGTGALLATLAAGAVCIRRTFAARDWGRLCLLMVPVIMTAFAAHFAIAFPRDAYGVIKGAYMQFGAPPLYALFGVAVGWATERRTRRPLLAGLLLCLWFVAAYTVFCRLRVPIFPTFGLAS